MVEPVKVVLHHRPLRFWFRDAVTKTLIDNHLNCDTLVFQSLSQLVRIGYRNASIEFTVLNQGGCARTLDVRDGRCLLINLRILDRILAEVVDRKRSDVSVVVVSGPIGDACTY